MLRAPSCAIPTPWPQPAPSMTTTATPVSLLTAPESAGPPSTLAATRAEMAARRGALFILNFPDRALTVPGWTKPHTLVDPARPGMIRPDRRRPLEQATIPQR